MLLLLVTEEDDAACKMQSSEARIQKLTRIGGMIHLRNPRNRYENGETWEIWVYSDEA